MFIVLRALIWLTFKCTSSLFQDLGAEKNYLRIQDDSLIGNTSSVDIATPDNMAALAKVEISY